MKVFELQIQICPIQYLKYFTNIVIKRLGQEYLRNIPNTIKVFKYITGLTLTYTHSSIPYVTTIH